MNVLLTCGAKVMEVPPAIPYCLCSGLYGHCPCIVLCLVIPFCATKAGWASFEGVRDTTGKLAGGAKNKCCCCCCRCW